MQGTRDWGQNVRLTSSWPVILGVSWARLSLSSGLSLIVSEKKGWLALILKFSLCFKFFILIKCYLLCCSLLCSCNAHGACWVWREHGKNADSAATSWDRSVHSVKRNRPTGSNNAGLSVLGRARAGAETIQWAPWEKPEEALHRQGFLKGEPEGDKNVSR